MKVHLNVIKSMLDQKVLFSSDYVSSLARKESRLVGTDITLFAVEKRLHTNPHDGSDYTQTEVVSRGGIVLREQEQRFDIAFKTPEPYMFDIQLALPIMQVRCSSLEELGVKVFCYREDFIRVRTYVNC